MTGFLKISVVLFLVRNALGIQQMPPNLVLYGIALVLTVFVTTPMLTEIQRTLVEGQAKFDTADDIVRSAELVREPIKRQLVRFTKPEERSFFKVQRSGCGPMPSNTMCATTICLFSYPLLLQAS